MSYFTWRNEGACAAIVCKSGGFFGTECKDNTYGEECIMICGNCLNGKQCHHINGSCLNGCDKGTYGDKCDKGQLRCPIWVFWI